MQAAYPVATDQGRVEVAQDAVGVVVGDVPASRARRAMSLPGWPIVALVAGADGVGTLDKPGARVLDIIHLDANTPTVVSGNTSAIRHQRPIGGAAVGVVEQHDVSCSGTTMAASMNPRRSARGRWVTSVADLRNMPGAAVRSPRAVLHVAVIGAVPFLRRTASPGAAGRSSGPPFRDRNGHEADDPSPNIGRHRASHPCDRETIPTSFVESAVNQVIGTGPQRARPGGPPAAITPPTAGSGHRRTIPA